ncbi:hypothetical protein V474_00865 [Novosphingobium barchaimii LL02]|uniref:Uncharacterized protein n=1 Tax=Novosphingobium barchaimii LL02 TaxID=1114963 RepID=A0A0J7Y9D7_9SPHN|nr:hypothetical protein [Novosphingobium barchaimii]KMS60451.1 hypothetical protein V474_00865 [Novosphingobium barchaimii LL02]
MGNRIAAVALVLAFAATPAMAADKLEKCVSVIGATQRLACYDALAGRAADETPQQTADRQTRQFGLAEKQKAPQDRKEVEQIDSKVSSVSGTRIVLENGMSWKVEDGGHFLEWVRPGQVATVKKGLMSGYRMMVDGLNGKAVVTRLR